MNILLWNVLMQSLTFFQLLSHLVLQSSRSTIQRCFSWRRSRQL